jgi:hypothetical protein
MSAMLARFGFERKDLEDDRIFLILDYKRKLDSAIAEINGQQYSPARIAGLSHKFRFHTSDLMRTNISVLLKSVVDSELYLNSLERATEAPTTEKIYQ